MKATRLTDHELQELTHQFQTDPQIQHCNQQIDKILKAAMPKRIISQDGQTTTVYSDEVEKLLAHWKAEVQRITDSRYAALFEGALPQKE